MDSRIEKLAGWVRESDNVVFFGGAGVSTESGIPDFRSEDGLYSQKYEYPPETILSRSFFVENPEIFYKFYREKMIFKGAAPNKAHVRLAQLEKEGKLKAVITQNIDGLHQSAGSGNVLELHGSVHRNYCMQCRQRYELSYIVSSKGVPRCKYCGGTVRPDVVLYEEELDAGTMRDAAEYIRGADVLIIGGTSLAVYPAAGLVGGYGGGRLALINKSRTHYDGAANLVIDERIGEVFGQI